MSRPLVHCAECYEELPREEAYRYQGKWYCAYCAESYGEFCTSCHRLLEGDEAAAADEVTINGEDRLLCPQCLAEKTVECAECGNLIYRPDAIYLNGQPYCRDCRQDNLHTCALCHRQTPDSESSEERLDAQTTDFVCDDCQNRYFGQCACCHASILRQRAHSMSHLNRWHFFCEECYDKLLQLLNNYSLRRDSEPAIADLLSHPAVDSLLILHLQHPDQQYRLPGQGHYYYDMPPREDIHFQHPFDPEYDEGEELEDIVVEPAPLASLADNSSETDPREPPGTFGVML